MMPHFCHWIGCDKEVPPRLWGCAKHWYKLPIDIQKKILAAYQPGQEIRKEPSRAYVMAAIEARKWVRQYLLAHAHEGGGNE